MKVGRGKSKRKKFKGDLEFHSGEEPVDLLAYRLAQRLFWYQALHGGNDSFQVLYERIKKLNAHPSIET